MVEKHQLRSGGCFEYVCTVLTKGIPASVSKFFRKDVPIFLPTHLSFHGSREIL